MQEKTDTSGGSLEKTTKTDHEKLAYDKLTGRYKHYCPDWDYMAIDETMQEFAACLCFSDTLDEEIFMWKEYHRHNIYLQNEYRQSESTD